MSETERTIQRECRKCNFRRDNRDEKGQRTISCPSCGMVIDNDRSPLEEPLHVSDALSSFSIGGQSPVQARGQLLGYPFLFESELKDWSLIFCINDTDPMRPSLLNPPPELEYGFFQDGEYEGFIFYVEYDVELSGAMDYEEVLSIVDNCGEELMAQIARRDEAPVPKPELSFACRSCGAVWTEGQYTEDCPECGGAAMEINCPKCFGKCGRMWHRAVMDSQDFKHAHWYGSCGFDQQQNSE